jgi:PhzF family phenazine biosynthesis protein
MRDSRKSIVEITALNITQYRWRQEVHFAIYDVFSKGKFTGNPAAVILVNGPVAEERLLILAKEFNLPETCVYWIENGIPAMRFSTSDRIVSACGHGTLAVLGDVTTNSKTMSARDLFYMIDGAGRSAWTYLKKSEETVIISARWPITPALLSSLPIAETALLLGIAPGDIRTDLPLLSLNSGIVNGVVPLRNKGLLDQLEPDAGAEMQEFFATHKLDDLLVYAVDENDRSSGNCLRIRTRNFFPYGVKEEAASGAASISLAYALLPFFKTKERIHIIQGKTRLGYIGVMVKNDSSSQDGVELWLEGEVSLVVSGENLSWL